MCYGLEMSAMFAFRVPLVLLFLAAVSVDCSPLWPDRQPVHFDYGNPKTGSLKADNGGMTVYRLPENIKPLFYKLRMVPNLSGNFTFTGTVEITVVVKKPTREVHLNCKDLNITYAVISYERRKFPTTVTMDPENEVVKLAVRNELAYGNQYVLNVTFAGFLNDNMIGFYRSSYKTGNTTKWLATTQFEPTYARQAFPCFDEPALKTPFQITVARNSTLKAISNMPLNSTSKPDPAIENRVWDTFEPTPPIPTYLVAFIVSDFSFISESSRTFKVWARENAIDNAKYILKEGQQLLKQLENYTGIQYILPKMDMAAIPDFQAGAMENWGLTTYRERYLTYDPKVCPTRSMEAVTTVVAHELAHQWFGDYVTPTWWDYTWLNEAFATYFESFITDEVEPSWRMGERFVTDFMQPALFVDGADYHHGMTSHVQTPAEIKSIFDFIIYDKGGSILRMLEHIVTPPNFKKALNTYLTKGYHLGGSVTPSNLWEAFEDVTYQQPINLPPEKTITNIMSNWTGNRGHPLINITRLLNGKLEKIVIEQETYKSPRSKMVTPDQYWTVPVTCTKQSRIDFSNTKPVFWSVPGKLITVENEVEQNEWIMCNIQQTGYYRVTYDLKNWGMLIKQLLSNHSVIHPLNRAQVIDDACALAVDHKLPFDVPLQLLTYLHKEADPVPLFAALRHLNYLYNKYNPTPYGAMLEHYITELLKPVYNRFGFDTKSTDDHATKVLRSSLVPFVCALRNEECQNAAKNEYAKNKNDLSGINPEVKAAVFCTMLNTNLKQTVWNDMWTFFRKSNVAWELETTLLSFGCTEDIALLKQYLYKLVDQNDTEIRHQYFFYVYRSVFSTSNGIIASLKLVEDLLPNYSNLSESSVKTVKTIVRYIGAKVETEEQLKLVNQLISTVEKFDQKMYGNLAEDLKHARNSTIDRIEYIKNTGNLLGTALKNMFPSANSTTTPPIITTPTTPKPSSATNMVPTVFILVLALSALYFHRVGIRFCDL